MNESGFIAWIYMILQGKIFIDTKLISSRVMLNILSLKKLLSYHAFTSNLHAFTSNLHVL